MGKKKNILYVWGYNSSPESHTVKYLQNGLGENYNVISDFYAQYNPSDALFDINAIIADNHIDLVVGSSLGGYLTMQLTNVPKVIINPCVHPEVELEKLTQTVQKTTGSGKPVFYKNGKPIMETIKSVPEHIVNFYKQYISEHNVWETYNDIEDKHTVFVIGDSDELLGDKYVNEVKSHATKVIRSHQKHSNTQESINNFVVPEIKKLLNDYE